MTQDKKKVVSNQRIRQSNRTATYCYSNDGVNCFSDFLSQCNSKNGYNCSTSDEVSFAPVTYCISYDNKMCFNDLGSLCNFTGNGTAWCNI